jgi:hypothetical protein
MSSNRRDKLLLGSSQISQLPRKEEKKATENTNASPHRMEIDEGGRTNAVAQLTREKEE